MKNKFLKSNNGFTLIETMVAVLILSMSLAAFISLTCGSLFASRYAKNEITANYLLQEVIDYVKNKRDSEVVQGGVSWNDFVDNYRNAGCFNGGCFIDVSNDKIGKCEKTNDKDSIKNFKCATLRYDEDASSGSFYNYENDSKPAKWGRIVEMSESNGELFITSRVEWLNGNSLKSRKLTSSIMNWYE